MKTKNVFEFGLIDKDPKAMIRACLEEMLASVPDNAIEIDFHLNVFTSPRETKEGEAACAVWGKTEESSISFKAGFTHSEGGES